jgi:hypothetical protein
VALAPLALVAAHNSAYRTAMIAAIIVLSAPATSGAPLYVAGVRMLGVGLGAVIGALVSVAVLPSRREVVVARNSAKLLEEFAGLLQNAIDPGGGDARSRDKFETRVRQSLRELGLLIRDRPDAPTAKGPAAAIVKYIVQMHADIVFLKRELLALGPRALESQALGSRVTEPSESQVIEPDESHASEPATKDAQPGGDTSDTQHASVLPGSDPGDASSNPRVSPQLANFAQSFSDTVKQVAAMARGRSGAPGIQELRARCGQAAQTLRHDYPNSEGARLMLRRLVEDLGALIRSIDRAGVGGAL